MEIVGYDYEGAQYCPDCIVNAMVPKLTTEAYMPHLAAIGASTEDGLDDIAEYRHIDRQDEESFDQSEFPKRIDAQSLTYEEVRRVPKGDVDAYEEYNKCDDCCLVIGCEECGPCAKHDGVADGVHSSERCESCRRVLGE
jgi:hypothetical protein